MQNMNVGSVSGNNNNFNQNNINNGGGGGKGSDPQGQGIAVLLGGFIAVVGASSVYLTYYDPIFMMLRFGTFLAGVLYIGALTAQLRDPTYIPRHTMPTIFGVLLTVCQMWLVWKTFDALPAGVLDVAQRPTVAKDFFGHAMEVWGRFKPYGHNLIINNLLTFICVAPAIFLNVAYAAHHLLEVLGRSEDSLICQNLAARLRSLTARGAFVSTVFTIIGYAVIFGVFITVDA